MSTPLRILIVEDSEDDALLLLRELRRGGYEPVFERVETPEAMKQALVKGRWDIVLSDHMLPKFSGLAALALLRKSGLDLPFIIVSGNIGEDIAVAAMRAGAHDYIIKGNLARFVPAVERELRDVKDRRERKQAEDLLDQSRQQLFVTLENINEGFFTIDHDWRFTYVNTETTRLWKKNRAELLGRTLWEVAPQAVGGIFDEQYHKALREQAPVSFEALSPLFNTWVEVRAYPSDAGLTVYFHDITERKKAAASLSRMNRIYSVLSRVNEAIVRIHEPQELYEQVCRIAVENGLFKMAWIGLTDPCTLRIVPVASNGDSGGYLKEIEIYAADVPLGKGPTGRAVFEGHSVICPDVENDLIMRPWREKALRNGFRSSSAFPLKAGPTVIGAFTIYGANPQSFAEEETTLLTSLAEDVSFAIDALANERKRMEAEKRTEISNRLLWLFTQKLDRKEYLDAALGVVNSWVGCRHAGIRIVDRQTHLSFESSKGYDKMFLTTETILSLLEDDCICTRIARNAPKPADLTSMTRGGSFYSRDALKFAENVNPDDRGAYRGHCRRSGYRSLAVIPIRYRDENIGVIHLADERPGLFPLEMVEFLEYLSFIIGEAIQRFGIEEERSRLASAVESSADAVVITEPEQGVIQYVNPAFEQTTGYTKEEALGRKLHMLDSGRHDAEFYEQLREGLLHEGVWRGRLVSKKKDGSQYFEDCTISPVRSQSGEIINFISVKRDVTEKLRLESIAESVNTMNNIGYVFSGVRHEIGNPINSAKMSLSVLNHKLDTASKEVVRDYVERALSEIGRVEQLLKNLRNYNLFEKPELENLNLALFMEKFFTLINEDFTKKGIALVNNIPAGAEWALADPRALQQVLLNIMANAVDSLASRADPAITVALNAASGGVLLQIADNGCGMTDKQQEDLFKPFYTSKKHGTGLGLVIVKKMLARMNSTIDVRSWKDFGTSVEITLPGGSELSGSGKND